MTLALKGLDGGRVEIDDGALRAFAWELRGSVIGESDPRYDEVRRVWNAMIDRRPGLVVQCRGTADVVRALAFARAHRVLFSVRGGGHNVAGLAVCEGGLVIDLSPMKGIWVDPVNRLARAEAGCILGELDRETQLHGLAAPLGFVSETGIAGLTLGGGFGYLTRAVGWTCDNLSSVDVVTADGRVLRAAGGENDELFWALRGGSGNFAIATSFEYRLTRVGPEIVGGALVWPVSEARAVFDRFREVTSASPRELTSVAVLRIAPPAPWIPKDLHGKPVVMVFLCWTGDVAEGDRIVAPFRDAALAPAADVVARRPYVQLQSMLDATQPKGRRYYWKSHYLSELTSAAGEVAIGQLARVPSPHSAIVCFQVGGAIGELSDDHSAAGNRDAAFALTITGAWEQQADDAANLSWTRDAFAALSPFSTGGAYLNFLSEDEGPDRVIAAYGKKTLARLAALKKKLDPENLFRHTKSVI